MVRLLNVYSISAFAALGGALFGFDISSMSGVLGTDQYKDYFGNPLGTRQGGITSAMAGGSLLGALSSSYLGDRFSRKISIQIGAVLWIIGSIIQACSQNVAMLIVGRVVSGLCVGLTSSVVPIYQSEIAPRKIRGRVVSLQQFAVTWGILIQYFIQYGFSFVGSQASFRAPWAIQIFPAVILFIGLMWFPKSPRWLAGKDRWDEALNVLAFLRTPDGDINHPLVLAEYKEIEDQIRFEREEESSSYRELFSKRMRKRAILGCSIQMWSQLCGINVMMYYIVYILESAGVTNTLLASSIQYVINMVMTIPSILWTDRWGRRPTLLLGAFSMAVWLFIIGGLLYHFGSVNPHADESSYTWYVIGHKSATRAIQACAYLTVASFAISWGPISWMYPPEIMPLRIRAKAVSLSSAANWATNFALGLAVPPVLRAIKWRMFFIFAAFNLAALIHVWLFAPETKQRTLEEMDEVFEHGDPLWKSFTGVKANTRLEGIAHAIELGNLKMHKEVNVEMYDDFEGSGTSST
ncbi:general substrate transporter [Myxozyma melibiosi]|uniref:General substrate transporter n=1 Tax=Myxozyma melibiosi TaxID=54550 RepID=A0ABR1F4T8_9ASCO